MVSRAYYDSANPMNIPTWSDVIMLDLTQPDFPQPVNQFVMPGSSDQLILAHDGVLGPGTVSFTSGGVSRNLQKLTLFNRVDASEIGNLLLGTEFNASFASSWLGTTDDQRIRLDPDSQRLFLPYSGYLHAPQSSFNPAAHRLNITAIANQLLTPETTVDVAEDIVRTVSTSSAPGAGRALAFGDSSVYALAQTPEAWSLNVIEEFATPIAVYRFGDAGRSARAHRSDRRTLPDLDLPGQPRRLQARPPGGRARRSPAPRAHPRRRSACRWCSRSRALAGSSAPTAPSSPPSTPPPSRNASPMSATTSIAPSTPASPTARPCPTWT